MRQYLPMAIMGIQHRVAMPPHQPRPWMMVWTIAKARRIGIGRALYSSLFQLLTLQGFYNCYAGITLPNPASVGLHASLGFQPVGVYQTVGYKLGAWHDVGWWQRGLKPCLSHPDPPTTFAVLRHTSPVWAAALNAGLPFLRV